MKTLRRVKQEQRRAAAERQLLREKQAQEHKHIRRRPTVGPQGHIGSGRMLLQTTTDAATHLETTAAGVDTTSAAADTTVAAEETTVAAEETTAAAEENPPTEGDGADAGGDAEGEEDCTEQGEVASLLLSNIFVASLAFIGVFCARELLVFILK